MGGGREALAVCGERSLGVGITIWEMDTGDHILHIPTSASPPHGLTCLRNQYLVASQIHRPGSVAGGVIFTWPLNRPQVPLRSYPMEAIGPLSCTKDGAYLAGGAPSGNIYIWEVSNGRLLKCWGGHHKSLTCLVFSHDGSLLISGSEDGMIVVWPIISLLDEGDSGNLPSFLSFSTDHTGPVTGLLPTSSCSGSVFVSSSLDGTCKVWDPFIGALLQAQHFPVPITAIAIDPAEKLLFSGSADGKIFLNTIDIQFQDDLCIYPEQQIVLNGHRGSITALTFCGSGLVSASEDCTACLWDIFNCTIIRRFEHLKGSITNLVVIPMLSLHTLRYHQKAPHQFRVSLLEKCLQPANQSKGMITLLPSQSSLEEQQHIITGYHSTDMLKQQTQDLVMMGSPAAIQLKIETVKEKQAWATRMAKHTMRMNRQLQSHLLDLMECRLLQSPETESPTTAKKKKSRAQNLPA